MRKKLEEYFKNNTLCNYTESKTGFNVELYTNYVNIKLNADFDSNTFKVTQETEAEQYAKMYDIEIYDVNDDELYKWNVKLSFNDIKQALFTCQQLLESNNDKAGERHIHLDSLSDEELDVFEQAYNLIK